MFAIYIGIRGVLYSKLKSAFGKNYVDWIPEDIQFERVCSFYMKVILSRDGCARHLGWHEYLQPHAECVANHPGYTAVYL